MAWFLYLLCFVWVAVGAFYILYTSRARELLDWFAEDANLKVWGGGIILVGVLILVSSFWSQIVWFLFLLGLLATAKGVFFLFGPEDTVKALIRSWLQVSDNAIRLWGIIAIVAAMAILSWI